MSLSSFAFFLAVLLGLIYVGLGVFAYLHVDKSKTTQFFPRLLALSFWWPYYDLYDDSVKTVCFIGKIILPVAVAAYIIGFTL